MQKFNNKFVDIYTKLLENNWEQIMDLTLTAAPHFVGKKYGNSELRLMVVGRAVNGWEANFEDCSTLEKTVNSVLQQPMAFSDIVNRDGIKYIDESEKEKTYFYSKSAFWQTIKKLLELYNESNVGEWYSDQQQ